MKRPKPAPEPVVVPTPTVIETSTLRPGLLVSLKTSLTGNVVYTTEDIEREHLTEAGSKIAKWETERLIQDPVEYELAKKTRAKAQNMIRGVCAQSAFGLLCPDANSDNLTRAVADARRLAEQFNANSTLTKIQIYVLTGRVAADDVEAIKAIKSEVRDLLKMMEGGLERLDVQAVREAAQRARNMGSMLSEQARAKVQSAVDLARKAARDIVAAGDTAAKEIDRLTIQKIAEQRTAFLDLDDVGEISTPVITGRAIDFTPDEPTIITENAGTENEVSYASPPSRPRKQRPQPAEVE